MSKPVRILYCNCTYAQVVPAGVKAAVLRRLCESNVAFEAVADLCEMSARHDPALLRLASEEAAPGSDGIPPAIKIAACYPRAVKWLFAAANAPLPSHATEVLNMRVQSADEIVASLFSEALQPNLPDGKTATPSPAQGAESSIQS